MGCRALMVIASPDHPHEMMKGVSIPIFHAAVYLRLVDASGLATWGMC